MKKIIAISFLLIMKHINGFPQEASEKEILSLEEAINLTLSNNYDIKIERYNEEVSENNVSRAVSGQLPRLEHNVSFEYGYSNAEIQTLGISPGESSEPTELDGTARTITIAPELSIPIFNGFKRRYQYKQLENRSAMSTLLVEQVMERVISETVSAYLEVARQQSLLEINKETIEISRDRYLRVVEDAKYGLANSLRKLQAEVDLKTDSANYRNTLLAYENSRRDLNLIMGQSPEKEFGVQESIVLSNDLSYDELFADMQAENSQLNISELGVKEASIETKIARATYFPQVEGYANYTFLDSENDANFLQSQQVSGPNVGFRMSWPVFTGGAQKIERQNAEVLLNQQQTVLNSAELSVSKQLRNAYAQYLNNKEQLRIEQSNLEIYELNYEMTNEDFKLGLVDASDVRTAQLNLSAAKNRINNLNYSVKQSEIRLMELSGRLRLQQQAL
ncbi:MAG: TolC family protein [Bacteroidota bacterium]